TLHLKTGKAYRQGKLLVLTPTTFTLLKMLVSAAPNLVTKEEMAYQLWGEDKPSQDVLRSHIYQLRSQLDKPFESQILKTRPKIGFYLEGNQ
ncbi:MAG: winged helix-turn-helix domain-containing protein, partial [Pseudomonadota bacterium]|nr:winged helix-turn-helix domain-containing protein [Pseudomonadota bacterium]